MRSFGTNTQTGLLLLFYIGLHSGTGQLQIDKSTSFLYWKLKKNGGKFDDYFPNPFSLANIWHDSPWNIKSYIYNSKNTQEYKDAELVKNTGKKNGCRIYVDIMTGEELSSI